ncbi:hypothetical protein LXL04_025589 [Taraxacum kok-saghyz]
MILVTDMDEGRYLVRMEHSMSIVTKKHITVVQRHVIYEALLQATSSGELERGAITNVASHFSVSKRTVSRIWHRAMFQIDRGLRWILELNGREVNEFLEAASQDGFDIRLSFQPSNSPDLNVLDLGFFRAIQSLQEQEVLGTIDELIRAVQTSFKRMQSQQLNNVFLTLQTCMKEIIKVQGGNNYQIPHIGKDRLELEGNLPLQIECDQNFIDEALLHLSA